MQIFCHSTYTIHKETTTPTSLMPKVLNANIIQKHDGEPINEVNVFDRDLQITHTHSILRHDADN